MHDAQYKEVSYDMILLRERWLVMEPLFSILGFDVMEFVSLIPQG